MLTFNGQDFIRLRGVGGRHAGIGVGAEDRDCAGQAARVDAAVGAGGPLDTRLIRVNRPS